MKYLGRMRWICTVMIVLIVVLGLETAALAYPAPPAAMAPSMEAPFAAVAARISVPTARFARGPHLVTREAHRQLAPSGPVIRPPVHLASADPAQQHLIAGSVLTVISVVLLVNFLWMVVVGAIWFFGYYVPVASVDVAFPPQAALFFVSFGLLVPGLILLPAGLKELKVYRAIQSADLGPVDGRRSQPTAFAAGCIRPGGWAVVRF